MSSDTKPDIAADYIRSNFEAKDRLAVVLLNKQLHGVIQRLATAEAIAAPDFQDWLAELNGKQYEVYISMNALHENANGRTKADVMRVRHVYLDFDVNGRVAVDHLLRRKELPKPNYLISTSPDKWQVIWRVTGIEKDQAEGLQKALAWVSGADSAAIDCARVLRLPGYFNHKYGAPYLVRAERLATEISRPEQFPRLVVEQADRSPREFQRPAVIRARAPGKLSQSERDWAYAKRALARGEPPELVAAAIAQHRRYEKHDATLSRVKDYPEPMKGAPTSFLVGWRRLGIIQSTSEPGEKREQRVIWPVATALSFDRCGSGENLLLHSQVCIEVNLGRLRGFMPQPKRDDGAIYAGLEEFHCR